MQLFEIRKTMEAVFVKESVRIGEIIEKNLDKVYLLVDDETSTIWLYKGERSGIGLQFIGIEMQKLMKQSFRGFYHTEDLNALLKDNELFQKIMNSKNKEGKAKEIIKDKDGNLPSIGVETETQARIKAEIELDKSRAKETCVHVGVNPANVITYAMEIPNPPGYHRHMSIIANGVYIEENEVEKFITDSIQKTQMKKIGTLPNGFFFLEDMSTRIVIKRGKVELIDLMVDDKQYLGDNRLMVPIFLKEKLHREGDLKILLKAFEPETKGDAKSEPVK